ncbi:hypothetical protein [Silvibacterium acidisoli]|uniref:hypothetical protein n=1 Tax=Acidobacteriaceae bacterium ZG23-2 TaxID=2883246 RepID=UPI00406BFAC5
MRHRVGFVGLAIFLFACVGCGGSGIVGSQPTGTNPPPSAGNQLGLDFDGLPQRFGTDDTEFSRTHAKWLRAFYDVTAALKAANSCDVTDDPELNELRMIHQTYADKYKIVFTLKYDFTVNGTKEEPPLSGPQYDAVVACTNTALDYVYGSIDILVSGNEPFETNPFSDMTVATFYQQMTDSDIAYRAKQSTSVPIYVGAFNDLQQPYAQTAAAKALLSYANSNPSVAGIDLHLHVASFNGDDGAENGRFSSLDSGLVGAVSFARTQVPSKTFISSEFSLVSYFLPFLKDPISTQFKSKSPAYAADAMASVANDPLGNQTVLGFYNYAVARGKSGNPITHQEWVDFLSIGDAVSPNWFTDRFVGDTNFLAQAQDFFNKNNFVVTTYSLPYQQTGQVKGNNPSDPYATPVYWLGALFCNATCPQGSISGSSGTGNQFSLGVADDFIGLQPAGGS